MAESSQQDHDPANDQVEYVGAMLTELLRMCDAGRYPLLAYFIEMACLEARDIQKDSQKDRKASGDGGKKRNAIA